MLPSHVQWAFKDSEERQFSSQRLLTLATLLGTPCRCLIVVHMEKTKPKPTWITLNVLTKQRSDQLHEKKRKSLMRALLPHS